MARDRGESSGPTLDSVRLPPTLQKKFEKFLKPSSIDRLRSTVSSNELFRFCKARGVVVSSLEPRREKLHRENETRGNGLFLEGISCPEKVGGLEIGNRSVPTKQIVVSSYLSDGYTGQGQEDSTGRHVGDIDRSVRCVPSHSDSPLRPMLPLFSDRRSKIQVPGVAVRADASAVGVHRGGETTKEVGGKALSNSVSVLRRLAEPTPVSRGASPLYTNAGKSVYSVRTASQCSKIRTDTCTAHSVLRRAPRPTTSSSLRDSGEKGLCSISHSGNYKCNVSTTGFDRDAARKADSYVPYHSVGQTLPQALPTRSGKCSAQRQRPSGSNVSFPSGKRAPEVLAGRFSVAGRGTVSAPSVRYHSLYRCVTGGVGSGVSRSFVSRQMGQNYASHQLPRVEDSAVGSTTASVQGEKQNGVVPSGQHHSSSLHQSTRRYEIGASPRADSANRAASTVVELYSLGQAHHGQLECPSRLSVEDRSSSSYRMETLSTSLRMDDETVALGQTRTGTLLQQYESSPSKVCVTLSGSSSLGSGCLDVRSPERVGPLCVPASSADRAVSATPTTGTVLQAPTSSTVVPVCEVGSSSLLPAAGEEATVPANAVTTDPTSLGSFLPEPVVSQPLPVVVGEERLRALGYSEAVLGKLASAKATSTQVQYKSMWALFEGWAKRQKPKPYVPTAPTLLMLTEFLTYLFQERKVSVGTIANYRSAVAFYWKRLCGYSVPVDDPILKDLLRGFQRERPTNKKRSVKWDLRLVLDYFKSGRFKTWSDVSDKDLTLKTVFLLALASGKRRGELHALTREGVQEVHGEKPGRSLKPREDFLSKTHLKTAGLGALKTVFIPTLTSEEDSGNLLCPVTCLDVYLARSDRWRSPEQKQLFIPWNHGYNKDLKPRSISNYLKAAILLAYNDVSNDDDLISSLQVVPHTVRHVATSMKAWKHFALDEVLAAGGWTSPNTFISFYLHDFSRDTLTGLCSLGGFIAAGTQC